ncbi:MAG: hypothetical protein WCF84_11490 [Anaerolineae bacterium]
MNAALVLLTLQGLIGGFDTFYYHEWRARLPALATARPELMIHAARDFLYAVLFATLPWLAWQGACGVALAVIILAEIVLTLSDFVVERTVRKPLGDVFAGERVTHAIMGIIYGAMLANLVPIVWQWWSLPTAFVLMPAPIPEWLRWFMMFLAGGVFLSGVRDLYAALRLPHGSWPWGTR